MGELWHRVAGWLESRGVPCEGQQRIPNPAEVEFMCGISQRCGYSSIKAVLSLGYVYLKGFPGGASGKEPTCQHRRCKRHGFDPWVRKIPLEKEMATHFSILAWRIPQTEEPSRLHPWGRKESDMTEQLNKKSLSSFNEVYLQIPLAPSVG